MSTAGDMWHRPVRVPATIIICNTSEGSPAGVFCVSVPAHSESIEASSPRRSIARSSPSGVSTTASMSARNRSNACALSASSSNAAVSCSIFSRYMRPRSGVSSSSSGETVCGFLFGKFQFDEQALAPLGPDLHLVDEHRRVHAFEDSRLGAPELVIEIGQFGFPLGAGADRFRRQSTRLCLIFQQERCNNVVTQHLLDRPASTRASSSSCRIVSRLSHQVGPFLAAPWQPNRVLPDFA